MGSLRGAKAPFAFSSPSPSPCLIRRGGYRGRGKKHKKGGDKDGFGARAVIEQIEQIDGHSQKIVISGDTGNITR